MQPLRADVSKIAVASTTGEDSLNVGAVLEQAGIGFDLVKTDLHGLSQVANAKPAAILLIGFEESSQDWVLNFVENNPEGPAILAVAQSMVLKNPPEWLYDVADPTDIANCLPHRIRRALRYRDMARLSAGGVEELGLSGAQLRMVSMVDVVTGLFNRRYFRKHLRESYAAARRYQRPLAVLVVRIENLSEYVEKLGEERSNDILDSVALALSSIIREADIAARIDDDLFGFLLPETNRDGARRLVDRLTERIMGVDHPHQVDVTVTSGFAELSDQHRGSDALLQAALDNLPPSKK